MTHNRLVSFLNLGRISYGKAWDIQNRIVQKQLDVLKSDGHDATQNIILLCEHEPVYTIGIRTKEYVKEEEDRLRTLGADFYRTERGGLITYHGPGQFIAYPILNLTHFAKSVRCYVDWLEKTIISTCGKFGIVGEKSPYTGVWVQDKKIAAIGIHCSRHITSHGIGMNCNTDLSWFNHIVPCGIEGKGVTSITNELGREVKVEDVILPFLESFSEQFECELVDINKGQRGKVKK